MYSKRAAEAILIFKNMLAGLFPVLTVFAYKNSLSPLATLAWSYLVAATFFAIVVTLRREWKTNIKNKAALKDIIMAVFLIAIVFHLFYYLALKFTSASNLALLSLTEVVFSFVIIGWITKKEPVSAGHFLGAVLMIISASVVIFGNGMRLNIGDLLVLLACVIAPIGNIFAKRALFQVSLFYLMFLRSLTGVIVFSAMSYFLEDPVPFGVIVKSLPYLLYSGLIFLSFMKVVNLFGFKTTSVTHTISLNSIVPIFTLAFSWVLLKETPTMFQYVAIVISFIGLYILSTSKQKATQYGLEASN